MERAPVFVVGTPRSGTTLLAAALCMHPHIHCGPETKFFSQFSKYFDGRRPITKEWPDSALHYLCSLKLQDQYIYKLYGVTRQEIRAYLDQSPPSEASALESLTRQFAEAHGKKRWAEKTPEHILHLEKIRTAFPAARIIRIVRDPRDVALSIADAPWGKDSLLYNIYRWVDDQDKSETFFKEDPGALTIHYERLITDTAVVLGTICDFLGERIHSDMLASYKAAGFVASPAEPWKRGIRAPIDATAVGRWKNRFPPDLLPAAEQISSHQMHRFGYEYTHSADRTYHFYVPNALSIGNLEAVIARAARCGLRLLPVSERGRFASTHCDDPDLILLETPFLGPKPLQRAISLARFGSRLAWRRLRGRPFCHIPGLIKCDSVSERTRGWALFLIRLLTRSITVESSTEHARVPAMERPADPEPTDTFPTMIGRPSDW